MNEYTTMPIKQVRLQLSDMRVSETQQIATVLAERIEKLETQDKAAKHDIEALTDSLNYEVNKNQELDSAVEVLEVELADARQSATYWRKAYTSLEKQLDQVRKLHEMNEQLPSKFKFKRGYAKGWNMAVREAQQALQESE